MSEDSPPGARTAATLIVLRDDPAGGPPDVLMLQRAKTMAFAAGAIVFPGGRVDEGDHALAATLGHALSPQDAAARIAAIRETIEEAGIAVGLTEAPDAATIGAIRMALHGGEPLGAALAAHGLSVDLSALTLFARWCPSREELPGLTRFFDARFYVARAPDEGHLATADATESVRLRWASAAQVLADCAEGREVGIFPTMRNLEKLALGRSFADVLAHIAAHPVEMVTPWRELRDGAPHMCIPEHLGYPVTSEADEIVKHG